MFVASIMVYSLTLEIIFEKSVTRIVFWLNNYDMVNNLAIRPNKLYNILEREITVVIN